MAHTHSITDSDKRFTIDTKTREVSYLGEHKLKLIQGDHNSERVTFAVPRFVEGHDMSLCTKIEVHFNNISADKKNESRDVYPVDDVQISPDSDDVVIFSWCISGNATRYAGILSFLISFECLTGKTIDYAWHTGLYSDVTVGEGMNNGEAVIAEYSDVLEAWKAEVLQGVDEEVGEIKAAHAEAMEDIATAKAAMLSEIEIAGKIVQNLGDSETVVPSQKAVTAELDRIVTRENPCVIDENTPTEHGYLSGGEFISTPNAVERHTTDFIELEPNVVYVCEVSRIVNGGSNTNPDAICFYDSNKGYTRGASLPVELGNLYLRDNEKYIRLAIKYEELEYLRVYPKDKGYTDILTLNEDIIIPQLNAPEDIPEDTPEDTPEDNPQVERDVVTTVQDDPCVLSTDSAFNQGRIDTTTGAFVAVGATDPRWTSGFVELKKYIPYKCDFESIFNGEVRTYPTLIAFYNSDKTITRAHSFSPDDPMLGNIILQNDEKYIRVQYHGEQLNLIRIYPRFVGYESKSIRVLKPEIKVPEVEKMKAQVGAYIHARRPIVAFILDGEYDMNADFEELFYSNGIKIGFAPQYTTNFPNNSLETYLEWQAKGHEILSHGTYILGETNAYTDEQAIEYIKASYYTLRNYGFEVHGLIGSSGAIAERYLPTIRSLYDYAATKNNGAGADANGVANNVLFFKTDNPYKLWRYGMQGSTLEQMKAAVDRAVSECGLLMFLGHAKSENNDNLTIANIAELIAYIQSKKVTVKTPYEAVKDYYAIRYDDIIALLS